MLTFPKERSMWCYGPHSRAVLCHLSTVWCERFVFHLQADW